MSMILAGTHLIPMDEPCLLLTEQNLVSPDSWGWRRYQILLALLSFVEVEGADAS